MASAVLDELKSQAESLFEGGSRYQLEKIATLGVYLLLVTLTLVWVFGAPSGDNELGASWGFEKIAPLNNSILFLENTGSDDWTQVRVVLNRRYLFKTDRVEAGSRLAVRPEDFEYFFYVPRPWGRAQWEGLSQQPKPSAKGESDMKATFLEIRARQGRLDIDLSAESASP